MTGEAGNAPASVRCLSFHADYACQNAGVCCSSGWQIAVEERVELDLAPRLRSPGARLPNDPDGFRLMEGPPTGCKSSLRLDSSGTCWFRDTAEGRCAIHREFGEPSLPSACRQFPRICVLEPDQVSVSLSHHCPTAAALLFRPSADFDLVENPKAFPADWPFEGLDVRTAYPPFLRPGVLLGFDGLRSLEASAVKVLAEPGVMVRLAQVRGALQSIAGWSTREGSLPEYIQAMFERASPESGFELTDPRAVLRSAVPEGAPDVPDLPGFAPEAQVFSAAVDVALRRYLAARLVACWTVYQSETIAGLARYLDLCLNTVLLFEAARKRSEPEVSRWKESIREADLWIVHHCDPALLAANLG